MKTSAANGMVRQLQKREDRIRELERMLRTTKTMLDEIAHAAGYGELDTYSAPSIIARLQKSTSE